MTIGELAARAGVPTATVRYYERRGLIAAAPRTPAGYRQYDAESARRLRFIKHAQALGFSLEEVAELLALRVSDPASCPRVEATTREKIGRVREQIRALRRLEGVLEGLAHACETHAPTAECPVLAALADDAEREPPSAPSIVPGATSAGLPAGVPALRAMRHDAGRRHA